MNIKDNFCFEIIIDMGYERVVVSYGGDSI